MTGPVTDVVELTRRLLAVPTVDGNESAAQAVLAPLLEQAGFTARGYEHAPGRATIVAEWRTDLDVPPLCLSGHLDTVPLGAAPWRWAPYAGERDGDRLYGRGSSDMKSGVAAIVLAAARATAVRGAVRRWPRAGLRLVLTAAEETGAQGARHVAPRLATRRNGPLLIAEPTGNAVVHGHKGALWLEMRATGVTAHGSTPHLGDNALYKLARAVTRLADHTFPGDPHPVMGSPTLNVGTFEAGRNTNSVPDQAVATMDVRTVAGQEHRLVVADLARVAGPDVTLTPILDLSPVWTDPADEWARSVGEIVSEIAGATSGGSGPIGTDPTGVHSGDADAGNPGPPYRPRSASFFTDATVLAPALGSPPTLICGPGNPDQAHATDEWCSVTRLEESVAVYERIIRDWCGL